LEIDLISRLPAEAPVLVVGAHEGRRLTAAAEALDRRLGGRIRRAMAGGRFTGATGQHLDFVAPVGFDGRRVVLVGLGKASALARNGTAAMTASMAMALNNTSARWF